MLTTPARSENIPPSPASITGTVQRSMAPEVVVVVSFEASVNDWTMTSPKIPRAA